MSSSSSFRQHQNRQGDQPRWQSSRVSAAKKQQEAQGEVDANDGHRGTNGPVPVPISKNASRGTSASRWADPTLCSSSSSSTTSSSESRPKQNGGVKGVGAGATSKARGSAASMWSSPESSPPSSSPPLPSSIQRAQPSSRTSASASQSRPQDVKEDKTGVQTVRGGSKSDSLHAQQAEPQTEQRDTPQQHGSQPQIQEQPKPQPPPEPHSHVQPQPRVQSHGATSNPGAHIGRTLDFMSLVSSPSRGLQGYEVSSAHGISREEQDLTIFDTQAKYRLYISKRIHDHCLKYPFALAEYSPRISSDSGDKEEDARHRAARTSLEEIMLLVRKLREGIAASHREDEATIEVYHLSLFLSLFTLNTAQLGSTLHRLVLDLYPRIKIGSNSTSTWPSSAARDFSSVQVQCAITSKLHLFDDSEEARSHSASLLLLSHTCLSDATTVAKALQDDFLTLRLKITDTTGIEAANKDIKRATQVEQARKDTDIQRLRRILLPSKKAIHVASPYQRFLIYKIVPKVRASATAILKKVYKNGSPPASETDDGWFEQVMQLDQGVAQTASGEQSE